MKIKKVKEEKIIRKIEEDQQIEMAKENSLAIFIGSARINFDDAKWKVRGC